MTFVAFVLSIWMTVALASGVTTADESTAFGRRIDFGELAPRPARSPPSRPGASTSDPSKRSGGLHNRPTRHHHPRNRDRTTNSVKAADTTSTTTKPSRRGAACSTQDPYGAPASASSRIDRTATAKENVLGDERLLVAILPSTPASEAAAKPGPSEPKLRHGYGRLGVPGAAKPSKPISADPQRRSAGGATNYRSALAHQPQPSMQANDAKPVAANIAPAEPAAPSTTSSTSAVDVPQLGRQVIGLVSDVGLVAASAVYTVANTFAHALGPNDFLGMPSAIATALANTAAAASRTLIGAPLDAASPGRFPVTYGVIGEGGLSSSTRNSRRPAPEE